MKSLKSSQEFIVGKHNIGFISSTFKEHFSDIEFEQKSMPTFQKLPRSMNDAQIESELEPGFCELGDILSFMDNAPEECKDGNWNLFYTPSRVVGVFWVSDDGGWSVGDWGRGVGSWDEGGRVFSPATCTSGIGAEILDALRLPKILIINGIEYTRK